MKKIFTLAFVLVSIQFCFAQYPAQNISLLSNWFNAATPAEPVYGIKYSGCYGWAAPNGKEYAIIGSSQGTYFIDVSNPSNPVQCDYVPGRRANCIWREYRTYDKYCYMISDDSGPNSFQIADLSYLPDSVHIVHDGTSIFERSHTIFIDGDKMYCGSVTTPTAYYSMAVYSLANPALPSLIRTLNQDYSTPGTVHDMLVRNDTVYASGGYDGLFIFKFTGTNFSLINSLTSYPSQGYNHSTAITPDGNTLVMADEVPAALTVKTLDISDLSNITILDEFQSNPGATAHNPYIMNGNRAVIAYYQDGLQVFDISDPSNVVRTGYFDTHPQNGLNNGYPSPAYQGCWGAYTELPSGNVIAGDMQNGLFMLDVTNALGIESQPVTANAMNVYPNPFNSGLGITISVIDPQEAVLEVTDITGRMVYSSSAQLNKGINTMGIDLPNASAGMYMIKVKIAESIFVQKVIKSN
jgi:choice-of-anchor B domain-containing protein